jgi:hypothetical protein
MSDKPMNQYVVQFLDGIFWGAGFICIAAAIRYVFHIGVCG